MAAKPPPMMESFLVLLAMCVLMPYFVHLILTQPSHEERNAMCPAFERDENSNVSQYHPSCPAIFARDESELRLAKQYRWCTRTDAVSDTDYLSFTKNCHDFILNQGYNSHKVTREELQFPIAFSILTFENVEQTERLLRAIYRPHNVYCIHVDKKAHWKVRHAMAAIAECLDNVFLVSHPVYVTWSEFPVLQAEIECMKDLWKHEVKWKYFINLTGREYPLRTNEELVKILMAYNGANDIDGTLHKRPKHWTDFVWYNQNHVTSKEKSPIPGGFNIGKGSTHIAASRAFIDYILHNKTAQDILKWMRDIRAPDEHYFPTLNHNPHKGVPGAYTGDPDLKYFQTRLKIWQSESEHCDGLWFRFICNLGTGDLYRLETATELFVNKLKLEYDPIAFHCVEEWFRNKTIGTAVKNNFDINFYQKLPWVKNHVV